MKPLLTAARFTILSFCCGIVLSAQDDQIRKIDDVFQAWNNSAGPGASVSVIHRGKLVLEKGYGLANLEYDIPIKTDTIFHVASVSKQFTAMAIVLLELDEKLKRDDDIHKYLPELPDYGHPVTIRNLLQHTSGIRDQWQTLGLAGWSLEDVITQDQILRMLFRQKELNFVPGAEHLYSNGGYTLAAEIVARVSGRTFPEFCADRIFKPLGMNHTHFHLDHHLIVKNRAYSYSGSTKAYQASPLNYSNAGATSLFTTATDLTKWLDNFREPKVGGPAAISRLREQAVLTDGKKIDYALGVSIGKYRGQTTVSHAGADAGFRSYVSWFPDQELGVAVVSNLGSFNPASAANKVAGIYLDAMKIPEAVKPPLVVRTFITVDPGILKTYAGTYPLPQIGQTLVAVVEGGKLFAGGPIQPPMEMRPLAPNRFYVQQLSADLEFTPVPNGGMKVRITQPGGANEGTRTSGDLKRKTDLDAYAGVYWSDELETQYNFSLKDGKLIATHAHHGVIALTPMWEDTFRGNKWFISQVTFIRDSEGRVNAVTLGGGRIRGIRFVRK